MMCLPLESLPALNACLNGISATYLVAGFYFIRQKKEKMHGLCMCLAFLTSSLFLISYLYYHYHHGATRFQGQGLIRVVYFGILISHTVLATAMVPMILRTFYLAIRKNYNKHKIIARWTLPVWLYVSVTGVVIYWMLYRLHLA